MIKKIKRLYSRRKAISPVIATILLIALTVAAATIIYFVIVPLFNTYKLDASVLTIHDTDKDSLYNQVEIQFVNSGTKNINITQVIIWTSAQTEIENADLWLAHEGWTFDTPDESLITASEVDSVKLSGTSQIGLSIYEVTYFRLEIKYTGMKYAYITDWVRVSDDYLDLTDLLSGFETFNLTAAGFGGTVDDEANDPNNYYTDDTGDYQLVNQSINLLPVLNETEYIPFLVTNEIVIFPSDNADFVREPQQKIDFSATPFRAKKFFILGLTGSWGDEFPASSWALNITFEYTDNTYVSFLLGHDYIDDWYYGSNPGNVCISVPAGKVTEIDLGRQIEGSSSGAHIHTHSTRFYFDYFKYVKSITFTDPNNDDSGPHLVSLTFG
ncbi:MAG: archaellin/type IV pilin N-terminal domain-containing protein [Candidatus Heimdallarchaeota archaeon]